jgi:hypothetical protein
MCFVIVVSNAHTAHLLRGLFTHGTGTPSQPDTREYTKCAGALNRTMLNKHADCTPAWQLQTYVGGSNDDSPAALCANSAEAGQALCANRSSQAGRALCANRSRAGIVCYQKQGRHCVLTEAGRGRHCVLTEAGKALCADRSRAGIVC